jgi:hypothetical protein
MDFLFPLVGVLIMLLRICEPFVYKKLKRQLQQLFFKDKYKAQKIDYSKDSLNSFLNSALNIEFVSLILQGVTNTMDSQIRIGT